MTRPLLVVFLLVEGLDLALYLQAPHFETGPMASVPPSVVVVAKVTAVVLVALLVRALRPSAASLVLAVGIAIGAFGAGTAAATLSLAAEEAPRPAQLVISVDGTRQEQAHGGVAPRPSSGTDAARTSAPPAIGVDSRRSLPAARGTSLVPASGPVTGTASWYRVDGLVAAAGPALRHGHWRGSLVRVCAERCVTVRLVDFCQCYRGERRERLLDLSNEAFASIAPLVAGLVEVTVTPSRLALPATDTEEGR